MSQNAIHIGFAFSQPLEFDAGEIDPAASVWMSLRAGPSAPPVLAHLLLVRLSATAFDIALTPEQTALLREGQVAGDLIERVGAADRPLGVRVTIPVLRSLSVAGS